MRRFIPYGQTHIVAGCEACHWRDVTRQELQANLITTYGLDVGRLSGMQLDTFQPLTAAEKVAKAAAEKVAQYWAERVGRSLWFWSPLCEPAEMRRYGRTEALYSGCGNGKTHLAVSLAKRALALGQTLKLVSEKDLLDSIKASYDDNARGSEADIIGDLASAWLLVLDDLGTADVKSMGWYQGILYGMVNRRYETGRPLVITTNLAPDDFAERLGPRTLSRLSEMGTGFHLDGPDRRRMKG